MNNLNESSFKKDKHPENLHKTMSIYKQYIYYLNYYQKKHGARTVVLMQVGMFHEAYGIETNDRQEGMVKEIAAILRIEWTKRDKSVLEVSEANYLMAGFPTASLSGKVRVLLEHNYIVVIVNQKANSKDVKEKLERYVDNVISPGTYFALDGSDEELGEVNKYLLRDILK
jgi:DNA mismatch repair ATPase MutS